MRISRTITATNRDELVEALRRAPIGAVVDIVDDPRTTQQNRLMWALLNDISKQVVHCGERYEAECWKSAFVKQLGVKMRFMPSLDGGSVVAVGYSSARLDKEKFSELIESIYAYGAEHGVTFHEDAA